MKWKETTLRKGTKTPKICRDMFLSFGCGEYTLCEVKNGRMASRIKISQDEAIRLHNENQLIERLSSYFFRTSTRRTSKSWSVVDVALSDINVWEGESLARVYDD